MRKQTDRYFVPPHKGIITLRNKSMKEKKLDTATTKIKKMLKLRNFKKNIPGSSESARQKVSVIWGENS